eukprot:844931-Prorocentrum_lima.AAC.1
MWWDATLVGRLVDGTYANSFCGTGQGLVSLCRKTCSSPIGPRVTTFYIALRMDWTLLHAPLRLGE